MWRFRVGDYRVLYVFNDTELWVLVVRVAPRGRAYR
jgi:mRNA-degrading endonuclease RelE of RelBE toxin-antitoxin system